jgi:hypothetical protein
MGGSRPLWLAPMVLVVVIGCGGGSSGPSTHTASRSKPKPRPTKLVARRAGARLPTPISGEAAVAMPGGGVLSIGGVDPSDVSTASVVAVPPKGTPRPAGSLAEPLHDAAAAVVGGRTLVFGGGAATELDSVEALRPGARGRIVGHLPSPRSDLAAATIGDRAYALGGFDGTTTVADVLERENRDAGAQMYYI